MRLFRALRTTSFLALTALLLPGLAAANSGMNDDSSTFPALSGLGSSELTDLEPMDERDLDSVSGGHFGGGVNLVYITQINFCYDCTNVTQSNDATVLVSNHPGRGHAFGHLNRGVRNAFGRQNSRSQRRR